MTYKELININSDSPDPELLKIFIIECEGHLKFYHEQFQKTKDRYWLGKMSKWSKWKRHAKKRLTP